LVNAYLDDLQGSLHFGTKGNFSASTSVFSTETKGDFSTFTSVFFTVGTAGKPDNQQLWGFSYSMVSSLKKEEEHKKQG
jgi:hypothetical protein